MPSGAFTGTGESPVECTLNAPLLREDVAGLEVRSANGDLMLYAEVPEDAPSAGRESPLAGLFPDSSWAAWGDAAQASVPELAVVPAVGGLTQEDAEEKLDAAGFEAGVVYEEGRPAESGKVPSQSPEGGEKLRKGVRVILTIGETATRSLRTRSQRTAKPSRRPPAIRPPPETRARSSRRPPARSRTAFPIPVRARPPLRAARVRAAAGAAPSDGGEYGGGREPSPYGPSHEGPYGEGEPGYEDREY